MKPAKHPVLDVGPPASPRARRAPQFLQVFCAVCVAIQCASLLRTHWWFKAVSKVPTKEAQLDDFKDPAEGWKDDTWPLRPPTPWDISTDFPYPLTLSYEVNEGTWLRLDVHPRSGDIVFDMMGDLYCLPASAYNGVQETTQTRAHPILLGVPHDSDPHFSPDGALIVFRSDAELGVENIWSMSWSGCEAMRLRPAHAADAAVLNPELIEALRVQKVEEDILATGGEETNKRKQRRLLREGRLGAQRVTNETYRWVSDARVHPSGNKIVATKWYTSARSLGAGEGWEYPFPASGPITSGSGRRLLGRTLPLGWSADQYEDIQVGPEQFIWNGEDGLVYSQNVADRAGVFTYSKDAHSGIYAIFAHNLTTQRTTQLVGAMPGGASRPELSRDGRTLAFVRRVRDKEALVLLDMRSGTLHNIWHGLTYDLSTISAPMGTYPSFAFTPGNDAILIWAAGKIHHVPLSVNAIGERVAHPGKSVKAVEFVARIEKKIAETRRGGTDLVKLEGAGRQRLRAFTDVSVDNGSRIVFQGAGVTYYQDVDFASSGVQGEAKLVPVRHAGGAYHSPAIVPHTNNSLVIHAHFSDTHFTSFELANITDGSASAITGLPLGRYRAPVVCECSGRERTVAFVKTGGDLLTGEVVATAGAGLYMGEIMLGESGADIALRNLRFIPSSVYPSGQLNMRFLDDNKKLLVQQSSSAFVIDIAGGPVDALGVYKETPLASGKMSDELIVSLSSGTSVAHVAFVDFFNVYVVEGSAMMDGEPVWSKPGKATKGLARVSLDGGHGLRWSSDGKRLFWFLGPYLHSLDVSKLSRCKSAVAEDPVTFGISCTKTVLDVQEVKVTYTTDISRLKADAVSSASVQENADVLVITNATLLTMETGRLREDFLGEAAIVVRGGVIETVGRATDLVVPQGATVIDAERGFILPGFIDVHAHWGGFGDLYPARSWELETFLAYGITTLHNPSSDNVGGSIERARVERGGMVGPRIFHTGNVIYGAGSTGIHQDAADMDEARSALVRIKAEGGETALSYKNYNQYSRASRQRLLLAARNLSMLCVPEGGMNQDWDLTYIVDGMTTVEHALPIPTLYDDVLTLFALSGTGSTPTHIVNYGGAWGEQLVWATEDVPNDPKLRRFTRHDILETLTESTARPMNSYQLFNTSASVAKMVKKGLKAHIGAHGEPPLGVNYHAEMFFTQRGGLDNYEVLRAATIDAAITLGLHASIGSLSPGKLGDFVIYPPSVDLIKDDISATKNVRFVARGGRVWNAETMEEHWPLKGRRQVMPPINAD